MIKGLIIGADAVAPELIYGHRELFPTLSSMMGRGASASYSAYVQKGYDGSYSSEQNWASIYTGLAPGEHGLNIEIEGNERKMPRMERFRGLEPFWHVLGENGYTVGLWSANDCREPVAINGYAVSCDWENIESPREKLTAWRKVQLNGKDRFLLRHFDDNVPERLYPQMLSQRGTTFRELLDDSEAAWNYVTEYHFQESLDNFAAEMNYFTTAMRNVQRAFPVDVLFLYTPTTDLIGHSSWYSDDNGVLLRAYRTLDQSMGELISEFKPEVAIFLSDHGQHNFKDLVRCADPDIRREAFAARDRVLWLKNGCIAFESYSGSLLFTYHSLRGTFIACGDGVRNTVVDGMRTLDIYPTMLEMFGVPVPSGRAGYVADIFDRRTRNPDRLLRPERMGRESIALIQTHEMGVMDIVVNELHIENRFADITVVGEAKYEEIFRNNPRVSGFTPTSAFKPENFDKVYCGFHNASSKRMSHVRVL